MSQVSFEVREVHQFASGGSHVVKYSAEMDLLDASEPFSVEILSVYPSAWASPEEVEIGRQMIQRGAVRALEGNRQPLGVQAVSVAPVPE